jgi:hypothetical protein
MNMKTAEVMPIQQIEESVISTESIQKLEQSIELHKSMMDKVLIAGQDYYTIRQGSKPSLSKSGAEKISQLYQLSPTFENKIKYQGKQLLVMSKCKLYRRKDNVLMSEGSGLAISSEKSTINDKWGNEIDNRNFTFNAFIQAVLFGTGISFLFTQDLEDMEPIQSQQKSYPKQQTNSNGHTQTNYTECPNCKKKALMKNKFGAGFYCNEKIDGCGSKFTDNMELIS